VTNIYDGRNEASHKIAKDLIESLYKAKKDNNPSRFLPLI